MASSMQPEQDGLKYLGLLDVAFYCCVELIAKIYEFAKARAGPLKPRVDAVEKCFWSVVGPMFYKIEEKRVQILLYVDKKVEVVACAIQSYVPQKLKETPNEACGIANQIQDILVAVACDVQMTGFVETSKVYYASFEPVAEDWAYYLWKQFLKLPCSVKAVRVVAPPSLLLAEKLNELVVSLKAKQLPLVAYVPVLPVHRIETILKRDAF